MPTPPFWGDRVVKGIPLADYASYLDERATFLGQWGLRGSRGDGPSYEELVETEGRPRLRMLAGPDPDRGHHGGGRRVRLLAVLSEGDDLVVLDAADPDDEIARFTFPRQRRDRFLCLADFFRPAGAGETRRRSRSSSSRWARASAR